MNDIIEIVGYFVLFYSVFYAVLMLFSYSTYKKLQDEKDKE